MVDMNNNPQDQEPWSAATDPSGRLVRGETNGTVIAGVCGALGAQLGIPAWVVRIAFIVASFIFGIGVIAYLIGWIVIPSESGEDRSVDVFRVLAVMAMVAVGVALSFVIAAASATLAVFGLAWVCAAAMVALLLLTALGWPRVRPWLALVIGLSIALPAAAVAVSGVTLDRNVFGVDEAPATAASIPGEGYVAGLGMVLVDLRGTELAPGSITRVPIRAGFGRVVVALPEDRCVGVDLTHDSNRVFARGFAEREERGALGLTNLFMQTTDSARAKLHQPAPENAPKLKIEVESQLAQVLVRDYPDNYAKLDVPTWGDFDRDVRQPSEGPCAKAGVR
jgi:phage shock protein PspC (stress-responsive transcriptional regulator)